MPDTSDTTTERSGAENRTREAGRDRPGDGTPGWYRYVEFVVWALVVGGVITAGCIALGLVVGGSLVTAKYALFVVGFLMFGLGSLAIQPTSPRRDEPRFSLDSDGQHRFEARIQALPPLRGERLPFDRRIGRDAKLFAASLVVLGASLFLEFGLGVRV